MRGRIFGAMLAANGMVSLVGMLLAGALGNRLGPVLLLNVQGGTYVVSGVLLFLVFRLKPLLLQEKALDRGDHVSSPNGGTEAPAFTPGEEVPPLLARKRSHRCDGPADNIVREFPRPCRTDALSVSSTHPT